MKKFFTYFVFFILIATLPLFFTQEKKELMDLAEKEKFDPSLCLNGYAGSWSGACICLENYEGRYCNKKINYDSHKQSSNISKTTKDLTKRFYNPITINKKVFVLSTELFSHSKASSFCAQLGKNFRLATRKILTVQKQVSAVWIINFFIP